MPMTLNAEDAGFMRNTNLSQEWGTFYGSKKIISMRCAIWYQPLWRLQGRWKTCECMLTLFLPSSRLYPFAWVSMTFERVHQISNVWMPLKRVNTSNLMTFEWCFLIPRIMRIAMQCYSSLYYVMYLRTLLFTVQRNVFISFLWFLFSDAAGTEHSYLVEIPVECLTS